jgi:hypothetical protein
VVIVASAQVSVVVDVAVELVSDVVVSLDVVP